MPQQRKEEESLTVLVNRVAPISMSLAFGQHNWASTVNRTAGG